MHYLKAWAEGKFDVNITWNNKLKRLSYPPVSKPIPYLFYKRSEAEKGGDIEIENGINENAIIFIQSDENLGFAAGNNIAIKYALIKNDLENVLLLNNDTVVEKDTIQKLLTAYNKYGIGLYGTRIFYYDRPYILWYDGGHFNKWLGRAVHINIGKKAKDYRNNIKVVNFITFCIVLIPNKILKEIGLLDETYFIYVEDLDYSFKVLNKGYNLYHIYDAKIYHKAGASLGKEMSPSSAYWLMKNRIRFILNKLRLLYKISSLIFLFLSRFLIYPIWIIKGKRNLILAQLKAAIENLKDH
jgi:GT2 family glycosyltransferase